MHLVYKVLVSCLPETHLNKLLCLVRSCFMNQCHLSINDLRLFSYAIVAQKEGQFVGVLFVKKSATHHDSVFADSVFADSVCLDSVCLDSVCLDSVGPETPQTVHEIQHLCVHERFRKNSIASELLDCCKAELAENAEIGVNSKLGVRLYLKNNSHSESSVRSRERLMAFFERHDFKVHSETNEVIHMIT